MLDEGARCEDDRLRRALRSSGLGHHAPVASSTTMKTATAEVPRARSGSGAAEGGGAAAESIVLGAGEGGGTYHWLTKGGLNSGVGRPTRHHRVPVGRERRPLQRSSGLAARGDAPPPTGQQPTEPPAQQNAGDGSTPSAADLSPGYSFPRSTSADSMLATTSLATGPSASYTSAVATSPATRKRGGGKSSRGGLGMRRGGSSGGGSGGSIGAGCDDEEDDDEEDRRISFRDATLVAWLNSVLFAHDDEGSSSTTSSRRASPSGSPNARQQQQHLQQQRPPGHKRLRSLSELKQHQLLALSVRKISGADNDCDAAALSKGGGAATSPKSASSGSGELFPTEMSISTGSSSDFEDSSGFGSGDAEAGAGGGGGGGGGGRARGSHPGQGLRTRGKWKRSDGVAGGRVVTKNRPLRNMMRLLPNGRKSGTSRAGAARRIKQDVALLLSGRCAMDGATPKIPGHMAAEVDKACAGDVNAVRNLLSMLKDNHSMLTLARAENGQGLRRGASSCDPVPRCQTTASISPPVGSGRDSAGASTSAVPPKPVIPACFAQAGGTGAPPADAATSAKDVVPPGRSSSEPRPPATDATAPAADPAPATPDLPSTRPDGIASKRRSVGDGGRISSSRPALPPSFLAARKEGGAGAGAGGGDPDAGSPPAATAGSSGPVVALAVAGASSDEDLRAIEDANASVVVAGGGGGVDVGAAPAARGRHHAVSRAPRARKPLPSARESSSLPPKASRSSLSRLAPIDEPSQPPTPVEPAQAARVAKIFASDSRGSPPPAAADTAAVVAEVASPPAAVAGAAAVVAEVASPPAVIAGAAAVVVEAASPPQAAPLGVSTGTPPAAAATPIQGQARGAPSSSPGPAPAAEDWAKALAWRSSTPTRLASRRRTFETPLPGNNYATTGSPRRGRAVSLQAPGLLRTLPPEITNNSSMPALLPSVPVKPPPPVVVTSMSSSSLAPPSGTPAAPATAARPRSAGIASDASARRSQLVAAEGAGGHSTAAALPKGRARRGNNGRAKGAPTTTTAAAAADGGGEAEAKGKDSVGAGGGATAKRHSASRKKSSKDRSKRHSSSSPAADPKEAGGGAYDVAGVDRAPSLSNRSASPAVATGEGGAAKTAAVASRGRGEDDRREATARANRGAPSDRGHRVVEKKKEENEVAGRNTGSEATARTAAAEAAVTEDVTSVAAEAGGAKVGAAAAAAAAATAAAVRRRRTGSPESPQEMADGTTTTEEAPAATVAVTAAPREVENGAATAVPRKQDKAAALVAAVVAAKARGGGVGVVPPNHSGEQPRNQPPPTVGGSAAARRTTGGGGCAREAAVKPRAPFATAAPTEVEADAGQSCAEVDGAVHKSRSLRAAGESAGGASALPTVRVGASDRGPAATAAVCSASVVPSTGGQEEEGEAAEAEATAAPPVSRGSGRLLMPAQLPLLPSGTVNGGGARADGIAHESPAAPEESPETAASRAPAAAAAAVPVAAPENARGAAVGQDSSRQGRALAPAALDAEQETLRRTGKQEEGEAEELLACGGSPAEAFGSRCPAGVCLVVEFLGSVESVPTATLVSSSWKAAILSDQQRLYKGIVRRAGVTPLWRAGFWEFMILRSNRACAAARQKAGIDGDALGASPPAENATDSSSGGSAAASSSPQFSLAELARQGMDSEWAKAIDADVARTFGERPMSFRRDFGSMTRQDSRRRHWWPESLGGAPLGARTPRALQTQSAEGTSGGGGGASTQEEWEVVDGPPASTSTSNTIATGGERRSLEEGAPRVGGGAVSSAGMLQQAAEANGLMGGNRFPHSSLEEEQRQAGGGPEGVMPSAGWGKEGPAGGGYEEGMFPTVTTVLASNTTSVIGRSTSSISNPTRGFSTLSPLSSAASNLSYEGDRGERSPLPSPATIRQLELVKGQLTDALRALAVSFGEVGYCQGLDYVVAHLIKCLGTDCHRGFASDPERVFRVILGLFRDYGLEHIYSEDLETLQLMLGVLDHLIETRLPRLHEHFREQDVDVTFFAVGWFQTLFLYNSRMPSDTLLWLWDNWVTERSYKVFFRAALAILKLSELTLLQLDLESIMTYLSQFPHESVWVLEKENLVPTALSIKITDAMLRKVQRKLDLDKERGASGVGWTRARPEEIADSANDPVGSDDGDGGGDRSLARERARHRRHEGIHGSGAPPVQAALRATGEICARGGRSRSAAAAAAAAAAASSSRGAVALEAICGHSFSHADGGDESSSSAGSAGGSSAAAGLGPGVGVDMTELKALGGGGSGGGGSGKVEGGPAERHHKGWAPTASPCIFGYHSTDAGTISPRDGGARRRRDLSVSDNLDGDEEPPAGPSKVPPLRGWESSSSSPSPPPLPSRPLEQNADGRHGGLERPSHVWPRPVDAARAGQKPDLDDDSDGESMPQMVPLHRLPSIGTGSGDGPAAAGGRSRPSLCAAAKKNGKSVAAAAAHKPKKKLGGKAEYAMLPLASAE